jgi:hypothetical protein
VSGHQRTHLMLGNSRTWCGKNAGWHWPLRATGRRDQVSCPRCIASVEATKARREGKGT